MRSHRRARNLLPALALASCAHAPGAPRALRAVAPAARPLAAATNAATFTRFAVAADHPEAAAAGAEVLAQGGTAADAAAATMLALGVASPASSGLGGGGFALYYRARDRSLTFLDFRERAPGAATPTMFAPPSAAPAVSPSQAVPGEVLQPPPARPPPSPMERSRAPGLAVGVPGEPRGIDELLRRFGSVPRAVIVAPAVRLAESGFHPSEYVAGLSRRMLPVLQRDPLGRAWVPEGSAGITAGAVLRNPALAATLREFAAHGAQVFYEGPLAEEILAADRRAGGVLTAEDLRAFQVRERAPLDAVRFGHRWVTAPPESAGGYTLLASLALLERWLPAGAAPPDEVDTLHALAESLRGPAVDRARYFSDPDALAVPVDELLAPARIDARARVFRMDRARPPLDYDLPLAGRRAGDPVAAPADAGTSHLCVVDSAGNVASVTTTINIPFGAGISVGGFWLNDEMDDFTVTPPSPGAVLPGGGANLAGPGHRPVSTMTPTIVFDGDLPALCVGGSGGVQIVSAVTQTAYRVIVRGEAARDVIARPRVHQAAVPEAMTAEPRLAPEVLAGLRARGHAVEEMRYGAMVQMIRIARGASGVTLEAVSDPRKGGRPAGL